jgi:hypothetical protein
MAMILIRFPDEATKRKALGFLLGRFSFKSWATGEMVVPDFALPALTCQNITFTVHGPAAPLIFSPSARVL